MKEGKREFMLQEKNQPNIIPQVCYTSCFINHTPIRYLETNISSTQEYIMWKLYVNTENNKKKHLLKSPYRKYEKMHDPND